MNTWDTSRDSDDRTKDGSAMNGWQPPGWDTTFVDSTDGVRVAVHDFGGDGRLLLFAHATGFCAQVWLPMIASLRDRFHCVALDIRAHGLSELPADVEPVWRGMADDVTAVITHLSPGQPVWAVGHSMGGSAILMAETERPGLVERAWTYEPILLPAAPVLRGDDAPDIAKAARRRRSSFESRQQAFDRYGSRPPLSGLDRRALRAYIDHGLVEEDDGSVSLRCTPSVEASIFEHHNSGALEAAAKVAIPFAVGVGGGGDGPADWARAAVADHRHLQLVEYPDLTHFGPLEEPDRLAVDVVSFLDG